MIKKKFKDIPEAFSFMFEGKLYIKTSPDKALSLAGGRAFKPEEEVEVSSYKE